MTDVLFLEAIEPALLLFLVGVEFGHALFQCLTSTFGAHSHLAFFFDSLQTGSRVTALLTQADQLVFEALALLPPVLHFRLGSVGGRLKVDKSFLKGGCELLLCKEMLLDGPDASLLVFNELRDSRTWTDLVRSVPRGRWRRCRNRRRSTRGRRCCAVQSTLGWSTRNRRAREWWERNRRRRCCTCGKVWKWRWHRKT